MSRNSPRRAPNASGAGNDLVQGINEMNAKFKLFLDEVTSIDPAIIQDNVRIGTERASVALRVHEKGVIYASLRKGQDAVAIQIKENSQKPIQAYAGTIREAIEFLMAS